MPKDEAIVFLGLLPFKASWFLFSSEFSLSNMAKLPFALECLKEVNISFSPHKALNSSGMSAHEI